MFIIIVRLPLLWDLLLIIDISRNAQPNETLVPAGKDGVEITEGGDAWLLLRKPRNRSQLFICTQGVGWTYIHFTYLTLFYNSSNHHIENNFRIRENILLGNKFCTWAIAISMLHIFQVIYIFLVISHLYSYLSL